MDDRKVVDWKSDFNLVKIIVKEFTETYIKLSEYEKTVYLRVLHSISLERLDLLVRNNVVELCVWIVKNETQGLVLEFVFNLLLRFSQNNASGFNKIYRPMYQFTETYVFECVKNPIASSSACNFLLSIFEYQQEKFSKKSIETLHRYLVNNIRLSNDFPTPLTAENAEFLQHNVAVLTLIECWDLGYEANIPETFVELYFKVNQSIQINLTGYLIYMFRYDPKAAINYFKNLQLKRGELVERFYETLLERVIEIETPYFDGNGRILLYCLSGLFGDEVTPEQILAAVPASASGKAEWSYEKKKTKVVNLAKFCDACGKSNATKKCSKCGQGYNRECQVKHWNLHKKLCK